jgi:energy-coupling factor transport system permease protein
MRDSFSTYHPSINFLFFTFVILVTVFVYHPVLLGISLAAGMAYAIRLNGKKAVRFGLLFLLPMMAAAVLFNVLFNHEGVTILAYLWGNPVTLETIRFGAAAAAMLASVVMWFSCYNRIMTSDKFVYLFGRVLPSLSLLFSMALRFVPTFKSRIKKIADAQRCLGRELSSGKWYARARNGLMILSVMATWALESAVETADSMKSRGYGLAGRTAYSIYRFDARDKALLTLLAALTALILAAVAAGIISARYYPSFKINEASPPGVFACAAYAAVCFIPLILQAKEDALWRSLKSKT